MISQDLTGSPYCKLWYDVYALFNEYNILPFGSIRLVQQHCEWDERDALFSTAISLSFVFGTLVTGNPGDRWITFRIQALGHE